ISLLLAATFGVLHTGLRAYGWGAARVDAQQSARIALERIARELRSAGYDPSGAGIAPIAVAASDRVMFQQDLDGDGVVDATRERVTYLVRPGERVLRRDAGGGAQPIIDGVRVFRLTYFDRHRVVTTDASRVAVVRIHLEVGNSGPVSIADTDVFLRNHRSR
ncbi:MAG: hypothetical protein C5B48_16240, partial [Candidatus Rokuibacteriota bacterium]